MGLLYVYRNPLIAQQQQCYMYSSSNWPTNNIPQSTCVPWQSVPQYENTPGIYNHHWRRSIGNLPSNAVMYSNVSSDSVVKSSSHSSLMKEEPMNYPSCSFHTN